MASLNRTQIPTALTTTMFKQNALHKVWRFTQAEQTRFKGTGVPGTQWECMTFNGNYTSGYQTILEQTLDDHKGGMTLLEWSGAAFCLGVQGKRNSTADRHAVERFISLRITVNGAVVAETLGIVAGIESFRLTGTALLPPGDLTVALQMKCTPPSSYDVLRDFTTNDSIMQYHVINNVLLALGRFR